MKLKGLLPLSSKKSAYCECNGKHPLRGKLGDTEVVLIGWRDYPDLEGSVEAVKGLDVFFGLDSLWEKLELLVQSYRNSYIQELFETFYGKEEVDNVLSVPVTDRGISPQVYEFIRQQFEAGKKIGFGCMAGHGRTGWVYAKLIKDVEGCTGDEAVRRARERFCPKCVESKVQVKDLGCEVEKGSDDLRKPFLAQKGRWGNVGKSSVYKSTPIVQQPFLGKASDPYDFNDHYYQRGVSNLHEWQKEKGLIEDEENPKDDEFPVHTKAWCGSCQRTLDVDESDSGLCPYCRSDHICWDFSQKEDTQEFCGDREEIKLLTGIYKKWMDGVVLSKKEEAMLDRDLNKHTKGGIA